MSADRTATIVSAAPGRVRVRLDRSMRSPEAMRGLAEMVCGLDGVREVRANPITGSLLVLYDPETVSTEQLYLAAKAVNLTIVVPESNSSPAIMGEVSEMARAINSAFGRIDAAVWGFTGGNLDAKTLVPLGLGAAAVRQIATSGASLGAVPWYVLLWYCFDMFTKYNLGREPRPRSHAEGV